MNPLFRRKVELC